MDTGGALSEFDLIASYLRPLTIDENAFQLMDDAAILSAPAGYDLVVTKDLLVADVHFFADDPPDLIAQKAIRANVSDLIAKGAKPYRYSLGLGFPEPPTPVFMERFTAGLKQDQDLFEIGLIGGDTTRAPGGLVVSVTAYGLCKSGGMVTRLGAKPGDSIYVTGTLGDSALGLIARTDKRPFQSCDADDVTHVLKSYLLPDPPAKAASIIGDYASAAMDVSDGLFGDLGHICRASNVSATIYEELLPLSAPVQRILAKCPALKKKALSGGDDYQCLMTVSPAKEDLMAAAFEAEAVQITRIGLLGSARGDGSEPVRVMTQGSFKARPAGYQHF
ncbi:MAG: thiamine-phosphate kinase [Pseudomonadota bacterium]